MTMAGQSSISLVRPAASASISYSLAAESIVMMWSTKFLWAMNPFCSAVVSSVIDLLSLYEITAVASFCSQFFSASGLVSLGFLTLSFSFSSPFGRKMYSAWFASSLTLLFASISSITFRMILLAILPPAFHPSYRIPSRPGALSFAFLMQLWTSLRLGGLVFGRVRFVAHRFRILSAVFVSMFCLVNVFFQWFASSSSISFGFLVAISSLLAVVCRFTPVSVYLLPNGVQSFDSLIRWACFRWPASAFELVVFAAAAISSRSSTRRACATAASNASACFSLTLPLRISMCSFACGLIRSILVAVWTSLYVTTRAIAAKFAAFVFDSLSFSFAVPVPAGFGYRPHCHLVGLYLLLRVHRQNVPFDQRVLQMLPEVIAPCDVECDRPVLRGHVCAGGESSLKWAMVR